MDALGATASVSRAWRAQPPWLYRTVTPPPGPELGHVAGFPHHPGPVTYGLPDGDGGEHRATADSAEAAKLKCNEQPPILVQVLTPVLVQDQEQATRAWHRVKKFNHLQKGCLQRWPKRHQGGSFDFSWTDGHP
eukprot:scaffold236164_cov17-Tisochrysis_lutea.AAC.1